MENTVTNRSFKFVARPPDHRESNDAFSDTSPGYLIMEGDSIQTYLGYYGRRRRDRNEYDIRGLLVEGKATNIKKIKHLSRQYYELRFNIIQPSVILEYRLRVFPDYRGLLTIYNVRQEYKTIKEFLLSYEGQIQKMENIIRP